jgi:hypothetical protein
MYSTSLANTGRLGNSSVFISLTMFMAGFTGLTFILLDVPDWLRYLTAFTLLICINGFFISRFTFSIHLGLPRNLFELPTFFTLKLLFIEVLFGVVGVVNPKYIISSVGGVEYLMHSLVLVGVGLVALWVGYAIVVTNWIRYAASTEPPADNAYLEDRSINVKLTLIAFMVLTSLRLLLISLDFLIFRGNDFELFDQVITYVFSTLVVILALVAFWTFTGRVHPMWLIIFAALDIGMKFFSGWSGLALETLGFIVIVYYMVKGRLPVLFLTGSAIAFLLVMPFVREARHIIDGRSELLGRRLSEVTFASLPERITDGFDIVLSRQSGLMQSYAIVLRRTPNEIPYRNIDEVLFSPFNIVPRFLWPTKPETGAIFRLFGQQYFNNSDTTAFAVPTIAASYMYGGYPMVLFMMAGIGFYMGLISRFALVPALQQNQLGLLAAYMAFSFMLTTVPTQLIQFAIQQWLVLAALLWLLSRRQHELYERITTTNQ